MFHKVETWPKASAGVARVDLGLAPASVHVTAQKSVPELGV